MTNRRVASSARLVPRWARPVESANASPSPTVSGAPPSSNSYSMAPLITNPACPSKHDSSRFAFGGVLDDCPATAFDRRLASTYSGKCLLDPGNARELDRDVFDRKSEAVSIRWHSPNLAALEPASGPSRLNVAFTVAPPPGRYSAAISAAVTRGSSTITLRIVADGADHATGVRRAPGEQDSQLRLERPSRCRTQPKTPQIGRKPSPRSRHL